jgi:hypothetical protein
MTASMGGLAASLSLRWISTKPNAAVVRLGVALLLLVFAGCSSTAGLTFHAPYGWKAQPYALLAGGQFWSSPFRGDEWLLLVRRREVDLSNVVNVSSMQFGRTHIDGWYKVTICGNQPALYGIGEYYQSMKNPENMRLVVSNVNGAGYVAQYVYPVTIEPNGEALAALRQLCVQ